jgi:hypothetical protein
MAASRGGHFFVAVSLDKHGAGLTFTGSNGMGLVFRTH